MSRPDTGRRPSIDERQGEHSEFARPVVGGGPNAGQRKEASSVRKCRLQSDGRSLRVSELLMIAPRGRNTS